MEDYPSPVEGNGLENRQVGNGAWVRIPHLPLGLSLTQDELLIFQSFQEVRQRFLCWGIDCQRSLPHSLVGFDWFLARLVLTVS